MSNNEVVYQIAWWDFGRFGIASPVCDYCNLPLKVYPIPVLMDRIGADPHALCEQCREESCIKRGDEEYFETIEYRTGQEPERPGINYGGRKKSTSSHPVQPTSPSS